MNDAEKDNIDKKQTTNDTFVQESNESSVSSSEKETLAADNSAKKAREFDEIADSNSDHWVYDSLPKWIVPYMQLLRLERPVGYRLLWLPCIWGIAIYPSVGDFSIGLPTILGYTLLFYFGAIAMRGAGCIFNDIVDKDFDKKVARTKNRPIASGRVSTFGAAIMLLLTLLAGAGILFVFDMKTVYVGLAVLPIILLYPFTKRILWAPQLVLGLAFSWGILVAWSALGGEVLSFTVLSLYLAGVFWTLGYDTIYATQDMDDDEMLGLHSLALTVKKISPKAIKPVVALCFIIVIALVVLTLEQAGLNRWSWLVFIPALAHFVWQIIFWQPYSGSSSLEMFKANVYSGWLIAAGLIVANIGGRF